MREIVLDTETTGLDPYSGHRVVEIGCVELMQHVRTGRSFQYYLNPERDMPKEAEQVHGLSAEFLKDKPKFHEVAEEFLEFIGNAKLVIHNASFDLKFLNAELEKLGYPTIPMERAIDTVMMARQKFPGQPANLDALCKRFNVDATARDKHGALLDSELLADVYLEFLGGRQRGLDLSFQAHGEDGDAAAGKAELPPRSFAPTDLELQQHRALLEKLSNPLWEKYKSA